MTETEFFNSFFEMYSNYFNDFSSNTIQLIHEAYKTATGENTDFKKLWNKLLTETKSIKTPPTPQWFLENAPLCREYKLDKNKFIDIEIKIAGINYSYCCDQKDFEFVKRKYPNNYRITKDWYETGV